VAKLNRCSFCGRTEKEVNLLIYGIDGYICDDCVEAASKIIKETKASKRGEQKIADLPKPREIKEYLDRYVIGQDDAAKAQWFPIDALPPLAFDHEDIMRDAIKMYQQYIY
jgi:ADP-ribose pyrophosphatase YjhB (NUDIX family)